MSQQRNPFELADERLRSAGFYTTDLSQISIPGARNAQFGSNQPVQYVVCGDRDAPTTVLEPAPYLTPVSSAHYGLRLAAHQVALGPEYCVVGVEPFTPGTLSGTDRKKVATGDFSPLSARALTALEVSGANKDAVIAYGYSMGADVVSQTVLDAAQDVNRGVVRFEGLGVIEAARVAKRGLTKLIAAMNGSGKDLLDNVLASRMPALNSAWGIRGDIDPKVFDTIVAASLVRYMRRGLRDNLAVIGGLATDKTVEQVRELLLADCVDVFWGRAQRSTLSLSHEDSGLQQAADTMTTHKYTHHAFGGDHSIDDNVRQSAGRVLAVAEFVRRNNSNR